MFKIILSPLLFGQLLRRFYRLPMLSLPMLGLLMTVLTFGTTTAQAASDTGLVDPTFQSGSGPNSTVLARAVQTDGKILIGGSFTTYNNISAGYITRLNSDGTPDLSFNAGGAGANNGVDSIVLQSDGKILVGGDFTNYNGTSRNRIARLNGDGTLDTTFNPGTGANSAIDVMMLQSDGKIVVGGDFTNYNGTGYNRIARLNPDGSLDTVFNSGTGANYLVKALGMQSDGKILVAGYFTHFDATLLQYIVRLNTNGSLDTSFNPTYVGYPGADGGINSLKVQSDDKVLIGGGFFTYGTISSAGIARLNRNGRLDTTFNPGTGANNSIDAIGLQSDGKILVGGNFSSYNGTSRNGIARLNSDGSLDPSFNPGTGSNYEIFTLRVQSDGKILIGGYFTSYNGTGRNHLAQLNSDGSLDASFNSGKTGANNAVGAIKVQNDGKILLGGSFTTYNGTSRRAIARLNSDGSLDASFNTSEADGPHKVNVISLQSDGKILIYGIFFNSTTGVVHIGIARLNSDGSLDASFNSGAGLASDSYIAALKVQSDGKILVGGKFTSYNGVSCGNLVRLNSDGSLDASFNPGGIGTNSPISSIEVQSDGKILLGGYFTSYNGTSRNGVARLNGDGSLDPSFNPTPQINFGINTILLQSDGKILLGGNFNHQNSGIDPNGVVRLNSDGTLDASFKIGWPWWMDSDTYYDVTNLGVQNDGKILLGGFFTVASGFKTGQLARLNSDGSWDSTFNAGLGPNDSISALTMQNDGKALIGGNFTSVDTYTRDYVARLLTSQPSTISLSASPNPSIYGQSVTFKAVVSPANATGTVSFRFDNATTVTTTLSGNSATYVTYTLSVGSHVVTASYNGNTNYMGSTSQSITQVVQAGCAATLVTSITDDGTGTQCGTLSYALRTSLNGDTINFALPQGNTVTFTSSLSTSIRVNYGVTLNGGTFGTSNRIIINGNGVAGDGLHLAGNNHLTNLTIEYFAGKELVMDGTGNVLQGVTLISA